MEWSQELCLQLINEFQNREVLWNPCNSFYYNKLKKEDAWAEVAAILEKSIDEIKKKIESLKGSYRREKTRVKKSYTTGKARNEIYKSKWFAYEAFQFLTDKDEPRQTISNTESPSSDSGNLTSHEEEEFSQVNKRQDAPSGPADGFQNTPKKVFRSPPKRPSIKRKMASEDPRITEAFTYLKQTASAAQKPKDRCSLFGEFIAEKLRTFDNRSRAIAEHKINGVLFELEMSTYGRPDAGTPINSTAGTVSFQYETNNSNLTTEFNQLPAGSSNYDYQRSFLSHSQPTHPSLTPVHYSQQSSPTQYSQPNTPQYSQSLTSSHSGASTPVASPHHSSHDDSTSGLGGYISSFSD